ncbi:MAG: serine hydrolase [Candidatus Omnitrophica bacterium]|nr:serine hydrolase [Candidatus Omnitrophota bacterium]
MYLKRKRKIYFAKDLCKWVFSAIALIFFTSAACAVPGEANLNTILREFEEYAAKSMADWKVPGMAVVIVQGDDIIYEKAFGVRRLGSPDPVTADTIFQIGSTSKAFTAALVAMLVDGGKVAWNDAVADHLDGFMMNDPWVTRQFTVTDLMAQRSGLPAHAGDTEAILGFSRGHIIDTIRFIKPVTSFRSAYAYQNCLFLAAARLVEKYMEKSWEDSVRERIFTPLGMSSSSADLASFKNSRNVAALHRLIDGRIEELPMDWPSLDWVYILAPAGGINSNIRDMAKWLRLQMGRGSFEGKELVKSDSMRYMHTPKTIIDAGPGAARQYYCQGWVYREACPAKGLVGGACPYPIIWHNGGTSGAKSMVAFMPQAKIGIVVLSNLNNTKLPESLAYRFFDIYSGNPERDWSAEALAAASEEKKKEDLEKPKPPSEPLPAMPLARYEGEYFNDVYGTVIVLRENEDLVATIGPRKTRMELKPFDRDIFTAAWDLYIEEEEASLVRFDVSPDGKAEALTISALEDEGCGTFRKISR